MPDRVAGDGVRARLQLSLGSLAELRDELPTGNGERVFAAIGRRDGDPLIATLYPAPPAGPDPSHLRRRLDILRSVGRHAVGVPVECGDVVGRAWVVDVVRPGVSVRERLDEGPISIRHGVSVMREIARALVTMHRRGVTLGSITVDSVRLVGTGAVVYGALMAPDVAPQDDLDALGGIVWSLLTGEREASSSRWLSERRRGVPPALDELCAAMIDPEPARRPQRAEAILAALDGVPTRGVGPLAPFVDAGFLDVRPRRRIGWLLAAAAALTLVALLAMSLR